MTATMSPQREQRRLRIFNGFGSLGLISNSRNRLGQVAGGIHYNRTPRIG
jgi:hypothetical protein